jgi:hypothetical protein
LLGCGANSRTCEHIISIPSSLTSTTVTGSLLVRVPLEAELAR